jgi:hypothetical protein
MRSHLRFSIAFLHCVLGSTSLPSLAKLDAEESLGYVGFSVARQANEAQKRNEKTQ